MLNKRYLLNPGWLKTSISSLPLFLAASHGLIAMLAVTFLSASQASGPILALIAGGLMGLMFAYPWQRRLEWARRALLAMHTGEITNPLPTGWPLASFIDILNNFIEQHRQTTTARQHLNRQIGEAAAQEERNRLARDLHDSIKQQIFSINVSAAAAQARLEMDPPALDQACVALADVRRSAQEGMVEMRAMLQQLAPAPLEKAGLIQALRDQCEALAYRSGASVTPHFGPLPADDRLPLGAQEALFRIAQEALSNIARHARAQTVSLHLAADDEHVTLRIEDDGQGFDTGHLPQGMGISNIRTRVEEIEGTLALASQPGQGTQLRISLPLARHVVLPQSEDDVKTRHKAMVDCATRRIQHFMFSACTSIFGLGLWVYNPARVAEPGSPIHIVSLILLFIALGGALFALYHFGQAQQETQAILQTAGRDSGAYVAVRQRWLIYWSVITCFLGFLGPGLWISRALPQTQPMTALLVGLSLYGISSVLLILSEMMDERRISLLDKREAYAELHTRQAQERVGWFSALFLTVVAGVQLFEPINLPPLVMDDWIRTSFGLSIVLSFGLMFNVMWRNRRWRRHLKMRYPEPIRSQT